MKRKCHWPKLKCCYSKLEVHTVRRCPDNSSLAAATFDPLRAIPARVHTKLSQLGSLLYVVASSSGDAHGRQTHFKDAAPCTGPLLSSSTPFVFFSAHAAANRWRRTRNPDAFRAALANILHNRITQRLTNQQRRNNNQQQQQQYPQHGQRDHQQQRDQTKHTKPAAHVPLSGKYVGAAAEQPDLVSMSVAQLRGFIKQVGCCYVALIGQGYCYQHCALSVF